MKKVISILLSSILFSSVYADEFDDEFDSEFSAKPTKTQTDEFDDAFDEGFDKQPTKKSYSITVDGSLKVRGYSFLKQTNYPNRNNAQVQGDSVFELNSKIKKGKYIASASIFGMVGTEHNTYSYDKVFEEFRDTNKEVPIAGIKELYAIQSNDNYDIILGKKIFKSGISTLYSPSDVYNIKLSPDPLDPYTIGVWLGEVEYYRDNDSFGVVFFPVISNSKTFSPKSRWSGNDDSISTNTNNFIVPLGTEIKEDKENTIRTLLKYKTTRTLFDRGVDIMLNIGYGPSLYTILEYTDKSNVYLETHPKAWYVSSGFSTTYKKFEIHAEVYYQNVIASKDDNFISAVGGATYTLDEWVDKIGVNKVTMTVEYVKEIVTDAYDSKKTYRSSEKERAPKNDILVKADAEINHKWSINYFGNFRLEINQNKDAGRYQKVGTTYTIKDGLVGELFVETFNGQDNSYYGKWKDNDRVGMQLKYSF